MGLIKIVASLVGLLILATIGLGAFFYFTDKEVTGTITEKGQDYVVIRPKSIPYDFRQAMDRDAARFVCEGYQVSFWVQSREYQVRDRDGDVVYDSREGGLRSTGGLTDCTSLGLG